VLVNEGGSFYAIAIPARDWIGPVSKFGLGFPSVDKTNADDIYDSRSICGEESRSGVKDEGVKVAVGLVVVGKTLSVDSNLDL